MADFEITSPEGKKFIVSAPEGATQEQVLAYAQSQFSAKPAEETAMEKGLKLGISGAVRGATLPLEVGKRSMELLDKAAYDIGGKVTDVTGSPGAGFAANVATQAVPTVLSGGIGKLGAPALEAGAKTLMQSALKPDKVARETGRAGKAIETMLEKGISPTAGGLEKTQATVNRLETTIQQTLEQSPATVNKFEVAKNLKDAVKQVNLNLDRAKNIDDIQGAFEKFWNHAAIKNLDEIPVALANKMKQSFYKELSERAYNPAVNLAASDKAQKALAKGLRVEVGKAEPAVMPSLQEQSELINVIKVMGPQVAREGNKNIIGLGVLAPRLEQVAVWMLDRYPWFKGFMAQSLHAGKEQIPATASRVVTGGAAATQGQQ